MKTLFKGNLNVETYIINATEYARSSEERVNVYILSGKHYFATKVVVSDSDFHSVWITFIIHFVYKLCVMLTFHL